MNFDELNKKKIELEIKKTELEIKEIKRGWFYKNPNLILNFFILLAGIGSAFFLSNVYDFKNERLLLEREELKFDIAKFTNKKDSINKIIKSLSTTTISLKDSITYQQKATEAINSKNYLLINENYNLNHRFDSLSLKALQINDSVAHLTIDYVNMKGLIFEKDSQISELFKKLEFTSANDTNQNKQYLNDLKNIIKNDEPTLNIDDIVSIDVYPNPAKEYFYVRIGNNKQNKPIVVGLYKHGGRLIDTYRFEGSLSPKINLDVPSGLYLVKIIYGTTQHIQKLIVEKP